MFWQPLLDASGNCYDPERFPPGVIAQYKVRREVWRTQYMLGGPDSADSEFDEKTLRKAMYRYLDPRRLLIRYPAPTFDPDDLDADGYARMEIKVAKVKLEHLRFYIHFDPKHKTQADKRTPAGKGRPMEAAIAVVGIAPDFNAFLVDYWAADAGLEVQCKALLKLYCKWAPHKVTFESVGAQFWIQEHVKTLEKAQPHFRRPRAYTRWGAQFDLPSISSRMVEAEEQTTKKEVAYRDILSAWINSGVFHLDVEDHDKPLEQLLNTANEKVAVDLVDCFCQGPPIWQPPPQPTLLNQLDLGTRLGFIRDFVAGKKTPRSRPSGHRRGRYVSRR